MHLYSTYNNDCFIKLRGKKIGRVCLGICELNVSISSLYDGDGKFDDSRNLPWQDGNKYKYDYCHDIYFA
jgi:hypothetical protein